jgi:tripartite-type tricarboxylate transporter receptor subunit TctC
MTFRQMLRAVVMRLLALLGAAIPAFALAAYPDHAITLVVPYPPGGTADIMARLVGIELGKALKQTVIVVNRGGAAGNIAAQSVKAAPPDGYTLLMANAPVLAINPHLFKAPGFDPAKDFEPIAPIADTPLFLIENPKAPYHSVQEFVEWSKKCRQHDQPGHGAVHEGSRLSRAARSIQGKRPGTCRIDGWRGPDHVRAAAFRDGLHERWTRQAAGRHQSRAPTHAS